MPWRRCRCRWREGSVPHNSGGSCTKPAQAQRSSLGNYSLPASLCPARVSKAAKGTGGRQSSVTLVAWSLDGIWIDPFLFALACLT